jgi:hypothetical protein
VFTSWQLLQGFCFRFRGRVLQHNSHATRRATHSRKGKQCVALRSGMTSRALLRLSRRRIAYIVQRWAANLAMTLTFAVRIAGHGTLLVIPSCRLPTAVATIVSVANGGCCNGIQPCNLVIGSWNDPSENTHNASRDFRRATDTTAAPAQPKRKRR